MGGGRGSFAPGICSEEFCVGSSFWFVFKQLFICLFLLLWAVLDLYCCAGFSLVAEGRSYSLVVVLELLLFQSTGSRDHRLQQLRHVGAVAVAPGFQGRGSIVAVHGPSCSVACGIFLDKGLNSCLLHSLPLSQQRNPCVGSSEQNASPSFLFSPFSKC